MKLFSFNLRIIKNVIVIIIDALRYDFARGLEDTFKRIGFVAYKNVISPSPWTLPSHASILTGLYPHLHGVHETRYKKIPQITFNKRILTLTDLLKFMQYKSYLISANPLVSPNFGFNHFNKYMSIVHIPSILQVLNSIHHSNRIHSNLSNRPDAFQKTIRNMINSLNMPLIKFIYYRLYLNKLVHLYYKKKYNWPIDKGISELVGCMDQVISIPYDNKFILINLMEVHEPYCLREICLNFNESANFNQKLKSQLLDEVNIKEIRAIYLYETEYIKKKLIDMMEFLRDVGIFDDALIIITSDHGQMLGEYGKVGHGTFLFDELLCIPLLIKYPRNLNVRITNEIFTNKYISLISLKRFIINLIKGKVKSDEILFSDVVFAESYGTANYIKPKLPCERVELNRWNKYRIACYYKNYKVIYNVDEGFFEYMCDSGVFVKKIRSQDLETIKNKIKRFLELNKLNKIISFNRRFSSIRK